MHILCLWLKSSDSKVCRHKTDTQSVTLSEWGWAEKKVKTLVIKCSNLLGIVAFCVILKMLVNGLIQWENKFPETILSLEG